jgi:hypothetical protein
LGEFPNSLGELCPQSLRDTTTDNDHFRRKQILHRADSCPDSAGRFVDDLQHDRVLFFNVFRDQRTLESRRIGIFPFLADVFRSVCNQFFCPGH